MTTLMVGSLYDALMSAGADEAKAKQAAEEVANYDKRFGDLHADVQAVRSDLNVLRAEMQVVKYVTLATFIGVYGKLITDYFL